ncbi:hypothetical protein AB0F20_37105 [Streptomyces goshikiensis]|uniref:hypothetical protein n=1 Tax=Streptomyces goshikiensis TaxID=1942 RepID=UPI0033F917CB
MFEFGAECGSGRVQSADTMSAVLAEPVAFGTDLRAGRTEFGPAQREEARVLLSAISETEQSSRL